MTPMSLLAEGHIQLDDRMNMNMAVGQIVAIESAT
jgi:hypothetical protein